MLHCLHRHAVAEAHAAIRFTRGVHVAVAPTMGCEGGSRLLGDFYADQQRIIDSATADSGDTTAAECALFERIERAALSTASAT